tara:strand:- start:1046 stop:2677 length:1632 start_codon:yes stop_codon:yes gene_type:complete
MPLDFENLQKNKANYVNLTPLSFLNRTADIYPDRPAIIYNDIKYNWEEVRRRCLSIAAYLKSRGIGKSDTVSLLTFNTPEMFEAHYAVPMSGAVLNTINTRLDANTVGYIIDHAESKLFIVDRELWPILKEALLICKTKPEIVIIDDPAALNKPELPQVFTPYADLLDYNYEGNSCFTVDDEWQALSLNYTSGTTGRPKGVVYHHRGSFLMSMGTAASWGLPMHPRYLYTVPMFHCNGWGHVWTITLMAGTTICLRAFTPEKVFKLIEKYNVTHFGGAPIVLNMLANAPKEQQIIFNNTVEVMTAGAPPPASVLEEMSKFNFNVSHVYGLTETYGHILLSAQQDDWSEKTITEQASLKSRQGVRFSMTEEVKVIDDLGVPVPHDGETMGEIFIRGNTVMKGYLKDKEATAQAFKSGYFGSGDLGVIHSDGYIELKDRAKDIIISGGENISSVEIEKVIHLHPSVNEVAVVAMPDKKWGEVPCAFVELIKEEITTEIEIIDFCLDKMARFKRPKKVIFGELPLTATGKIQKKSLRDRAIKLAKD